MFVISHIKQYLRRIQHIYWIRKAALASIIIIDLIAAGGILRADGILLSDKSILIAAIAGGSGMYTLFVTCVTSDWAVIGAMVSVISIFICGLIVA